jgi:hypothetical protein
MSTSQLIGGVWVRGAALSPTNMLVGSKTWDPAATGQWGLATTTVTVAGAAVGDTVLASMSTMVASVELSAWVSVADTVTVHLMPLAGTVDIASGTLTVQVIPAAGLTAVAPPIYVVDATVTTAAPSHTQSFARAGAATSNRVVVWPVAIDDTDELDPVIVTGRVDAAGFVRLTITAITGRLAPGVRRVAYSLAS